LKPAAIFVLLFCFKYLTTDRRLAPNTSAYPPTFRFFSKKMKAQR
jgi:hypothetical protein